jgi:hypothetical protein
MNPVTVVMAQFVELEAVRTGFTTLQNGGVDADDIRIGGDRAEKVQAATADESERAQLDQQLEHFVAGRVIRGVALGAFVGALIGAVIAAIAVSLVDLRSAQRPLVFVVLLVALAALGGVLGAFLSVERSVGYDDTWQLTLDTEHEGSTWIAVRVSDDDARDAVLELLRNTNPEPSKIEVRSVRPNGAHTVQW